ncbi:S100 calcium binding protein W [Sardina pilchardus]|uniref:S100 calcium binding protein W n=1 Tax=Sardina pilchardus TaxID=27697 RepID=UPI002E0EEE14
MSRSKLETAIISLVEVYEEYAGKDEKKFQLSQAELAELFEKELASPEFQGKIDPEDIQAAMSKLDKNHDGEVNFREFGQMVGLLARGVFRKKRGKGKGKKDDE